MTETKITYYAALRGTQKTILDESCPTTDYDPWLSYFLRTLKRQCDLVDKKLDAPNVDLKGFTKQMLEAVRKSGGGGISEIEKFIDAPRNKIRAGLKELVVLGLVERKGDRKGTWYKARG